MTGKGAIIEKILADAENKCDEIIAKAKAEGDALIAKAEEENALLRKEAEGKSKEIAAETLRRRMSVAQLDAKKHNLFLRQQLIEKSFDAARKSVVTMNDVDYLALIAKLINQFAEEGETVTVCKNDSKRVTQAFLDKFGKNLMLDKEFGSFDGGLVLSKSGYDKNLTLEVLITESRERVEDKVSSILFTVE